MLHGYNPYPTPGNPLFDTPRPPWLSEDEVWPIVADDTTVATDAGFPPGSSLPVLDYGDPFALPGREYAPPVYDVPEFQADLPQLEYAPMDKRAIDAARARAGAGERRKVQSAVDRALSYGLDDRAVGETIAGQGTALANVMVGAGRQALGEISTGKGYEFRADVINYDTQVQDIFGQYRTQLDAAQRNFATLSGVYDQDLFVAEDEAKRNFDTRILELQMNFEARLQKYLLSGVKTITEIHTRR